MQAKNKLGEGWLSSEGGRNLFSLKEERPNFVHSVSNGVRVKEMTSFKQPPNCSIQLKISYWI